MFREKIFRPLLLVSLLLLGGCANHRPIPSFGPEPPPDVMGPPIPETHVDESEMPPEAYGPVQPPATATAVSTNAGIATAVSTDTAAAASAASATATNTTVSTSTSTAGPPEPAKLCLVLGPGMAKAMAEAAVLEAIRKAKLPVHCVVGTEMGAIVGALYSYSNGSTNSLQWQLFKLNKDNYFAFPMLSLHDPKSSGEKLHEFLHGLFHDAQVDRLPIKFATTAVDDENDSEVDLDKGLLSDALSTSAAVNGVFEPWKINGNAYRSAALANPVPLELARRLGGNFIVMVDVLLDGGAPAKSRYHRAFTSARSVIKLQKKEAAFVIQVNTGNIAFDDFGRRAEILAAGTSAAEKAMPELKAAWEKWSAAPH
ncbi:MAG: patatin-like phospholipase family protein [Bdellovibrionota bacterium]